MTNKRPIQYKQTDNNNFNLNTPFDTSKFNFEKASAEEHIAETKEAVVLVNISPLFESHSLYIPYLYMKCPQFISHANVL